MLMFGFLVCSFNLLAFEPSNGEVKELAAHYMLRKGMTQETAKELVREDILYLNQALAKGGYTITPETPTFSTQQLLNLQKIYGRRSFDNAQHSFWKRPYKKWSEWVVEESNDAWLCLTSFGKCINDLLPHVCIMGGSAPTRKELDAIFLKSADDLYQHWQWLLHLVEQSPKEEDDELDMHTFITTYTNGFYTGLSTSNASIVALRDLRNMHRHVLSILEMDQRANHPHEKPPYISCDQVFVNNCAAIHNLFQTKQPDSNIKDWFGWAQNKPGQVMSALHLPSKGNPALELSMALSKQDFGVFQKSTIPASNSVLQSINTNTDPIFSERSPHKKLAKKRNI